MLFSVSPQCVNRPLFVNTMAISWLFYVSVLTACCSAPMWTQKEDKAHHVLNSHCTSQCKGGGGKLRTWVTQLIFTFLSTQVLQLVITNVWCPETWDTESKSCILLELFCKYWMRHSGYKCVEVINMTSLHISEFRFSDSAASKRWQGKF